MERGEAEDSPVHVHGGVLASWPRKFGGNNVGLCGELDSTNAEQIKGFIKATQK